MKRIDDDDDARGAAPILDGIDGERVAGGPFLEGCARERWHGVNSGAAASRAGRLRRGSCRAARRGDRCRGDRRARRVRTRGARRGASRSPASSTSRGSSATWRRPSRSRRARGPEGCRGARALDELLVVDGRVVGSREGLPEGDEEEPVLVLVVVSVVLVVVEEAVVRGGEGFEVEGALPPLPSSASFDPSSSGIHRGGP